MWSGHMASQRKGLVAHHVLTNEHLFREIVAWSEGWPGLIVFRQRADKSNKKRAKRSQITVDIARIPDTRTLRILSTARWYVGGSLSRVRFTGVDDLIRAGDATALRLVFDAMRECGPHDPSHNFYFKYYYWSLAIAHYRGSCGILDVLKSMAPSKLPNGDFLVEIRHAAVARWFVEAYGVTVLPKTLIQIAAKENCRALFYFLLDVLGQDASLDDIAIGARQRHMLSLLCRCRNGGVATSAQETLDLAIEQHDEELIRLLLPDLSPYCEKGAIDKALAILEARAWDKPLRMAPPVDGTDCYEVSENKSESWGTRLRQGIAKLKVRMFGESTDGTVVYRERRLPAWLDNIITQIEDGDE